MQGRLLMMPSSSQVLDHQLKFHIMYGLGQFHHRQDKGEERRGEIWQKKATVAQQTQREKGVKKAATASQIQRIGKIVKKQLTAATWLEDLCRSKSGNLDVVNNGLEQRRSNSRGVEQRRSREVQQPVVKSSSQQLGKRVEQQPASRSKSSQQQQVEQQQFSRVELEDRKRDRDIVQSQKMREKSTKISKQQQQLSRVNRVRQTHSNNIS